jgi:hypothetical protein
MAFLHSTGRALDHDEIRVLEQVPDGLLLKQEVRGRQLSVRDGAVASAVASR